MKFYGEPNQLVRFTTPSLRNGNKHGFRFDDNGVYETNNKKLIQALKLKFKHEDDNLPIEVKEDEIEANVVENSNIVEEIKEVKRSRKGGK